MASAVAPASLSALNRAIKDKHVDRAWELSCSLRFVPLRYAARLVQLLVKENDPRLDLAARRFMVRVLEEIEPERASLLDFDRSQLDPTHYLARPTRSTPAASLRFPPSSVSETHSISPASPGGPATFGGPW